MRVRSMSRSLLSWSDLADLLEDFVRKLPLVVEDLAFEVLEDLQPND